MLVIMTEQVRVKVHGQVQGVGFRFSTAREAERLGLDGWVKNLLDGTVEAQLVGDDAAVENMLTWLSHGPRTASVSRVEVIHRGPGEPGGRFHIA
jgi:acylphosphatase